MIERVPWWTSKKDQPEPRNNFVSWNGLLNTAETPFEDLSPTVKFLSQHDPKLNSPTNADTAQL